MGVKRLCGFVVSRVDGAAAAARIALHSLVTFLPGPPRSTDDDHDDDDADVDGAAPLDQSCASRIGPLFSAGFRAREESSALPSFFPSFHPRVRERVQLRHQTIDRQPRPSRSPPPPSAPRGFFQ